jgi:NAD(P)-dependent dehydrogenase (short-subunit alcohol dehydrogenase family)
MSAGPIRFDEQVVLVTGAGRGLGAAYARGFAARGATVVVHDAGLELDGTGADPSVADAVVEEIRSSGGTAVVSYEDIADPGACRRLVEHAVESLGRIDVVVHNAGLLVFEELEEADRSWDAVRSVAVDAPFHVTRAAFPVMKSQRYGRFVFTTSGRSMWLEHARPGLAAYAAGKLAGLGLMLAAAVEGDAHGIRANAVSPVAATRMSQGATDKGELDPELVAPGVLFLASRACDFSGVVLRAADGRFSTVGWHAGDVLDFGREPVGPEEISDRWAEFDWAARAA